MRRVVFVLAPRVHLLDLAGPAQVFSTATDFGFGYRLSYLADASPVPSHQGVPLVAELNWPALGREDIVLVPGWRSPLAAGELGPALVGTGSTPTSPGRCRWPNWPTAPGSASAP